jgi:starvation-inducible DNA-binding protein
MLDPQVDAVRLMADETAERITTLGGSPVGTPGALVAQRDWDDYSIGRADAIAHLGALDVVYTGIIEAHRSAIEETEELDPVTQDVLIGQSAQLEQFHWFVRAHLENSDGSLSTGRAQSEKSAAKRARK